MSKSKQSKSMKDKAFLSLSVLFLLFFFAGIAVLTLEKPTSFLLRAKTENPSPLKSFAIAFPQVGAVGTKIKVSVYTRDVNGKVLSNRRVKLEAPNSNIAISPSNTVNTNDIGMAEFFITSTEAGTVQLSATDVNSNTVIVNIPSVEFR
jgi:hypothetical protein